MGQYPAHPVGQPAYGGQQPYGGQPQMPQGGYTQPPPGVYTTGYAVVGPFWFDLSLLLYCFAPFVRSSVSLRL